MVFKVGSTLEYSVRIPSTIILNIHAQQSPSQTVRDEHFALAPKLDYDEFASLDAHSRLMRISTGSAGQLRIAYSAIVERTPDAAPNRSSGDTPVATLEASAIPYLFPSRYCQSDRLGRLAWDLDPRRLRQLHRSGRLACAGRRAERYDRCDGAKDAVLPRP